MFRGCFVLSQESFVILVGSDQPVDDEESVMERSEEDATEAPDVQTLGMAWPNLHSQLVTSWIG